MTKNEFQEIVKMLERKIGRTMPERIQKTYWDDFGHGDFETIMQNLTQLKTDENGIPISMIVIEGATSEMNKKVNDLITTLFNTEAGDYVKDLLVQFIEHEHKQDWEKKWKKEKKEYFRKNNYRTFSLN